MKRHICLFALSVAGLASSCQHSSSTPNIRKETRKDKPAALVMSGNNEVNPYGSLFYAERTDDTYVENVGSVATYRFIGRRFPEEASYILASQSLGGPRQPVAKYEVDDEGQLGRQIDVGTLMLDNEMILMFDYFKGEPVDYWLCSTDGKSRLRTTFVPYPIVSYGRDGAVISIRRLTQDAGLVLLEGIDFNPDENILVSTQSGTKRTSNVPIVCTNGKFSMVLEPAYAGKSGGTAYVDVMRMNERLMVEYEWGCEAINPKKRQANTSRIKQDALLKLPTTLD